MQWDLNSFFFPKTYKNRPAAEGLCPQTPIAISGWGLCPQTTVSDTFEYSSLLNTSSKLDFYTFQQLVFALFFTKILAKCHQATASDLPFYDIFAPQKITFSKISDDVIACDLWFGPPPQSKILATPMPPSLPRLWRINMDQSINQSNKNNSIKIRAKFKKVNTIISIYSTES